MEQPEQNENRAIYYMSISAFAGAVVAASMKSLSFSMSPLIAFWLSRFFPLIGLIPMGLKGHLKHLKTKVFGKHLILNCLYVSSILFYFYALGFIPLVNASLLFNSAPLYTPIIAILFLKEEFPARVWGYIGLSFLGVILVLQPHSSAFTWVSLFAALSGLLMAGAQISNRVLSYSDPPEKIVFYMIVLAPILGTIPILVIPSLITDLPVSTLLNWTICAKLLLAGISTWIFQLYRSKSASRGRVSIVMPFSYLGVVFAGFFDWMFWNVLPDYLTLLGVVLIVIGSFFIFRTAHHQPTH